MSQYDIAYEIETFLDDQREIIIRYKKAIIEDCEELDKDEVYDFSYLDGKINKRLTDFVNECLDKYVKIQEKTMKKFRR